MAKIIKQNAEAYNLIDQGVKKLAETVTVTLGPKGKNVALNRKWAAPIVLNDGASIAREIELEDPFENMGAELVKESSLKTLDSAGDGTTTSCLLAWKLIEKGRKLIDNGTNPMIMKEGISKAVDFVVIELRKQAIPVKNEDLIDVATISAANSEIGKMIAETIQKVGSDGVITIEDGMGEETTVEYKEGMMFEEGYGSPAFITDTDEQIAEINDPLILYTDMVIDSQQDLSDFLGNVLTEKQRNIIIIAHEFQSFALPLLVENHRKGNIRCIAVKAPSFGLKRIWMLEDMATLTGGTVITRQSGRTLSSIKTEELGKAEKVWADKDYTKIIGGKGNKKAIQERISSLRSQVLKEKSEFEKKKLKERIARLSSGAAIIHVGALTETELKDKRERIDDAVQATRAAVAEGIVAGGGIALYNIIPSLNEVIDKEKDQDIKNGIILVQSILDEPLRKILENAGKTPEIIIEHLLDIHVEIGTGKLVDNMNWGYDVIRNVYGDAFEMGIIDPVKVTRQALQNAASVSSMILTIEAMVSDNPDKETYQDKPPLV